MHWERIRNFLLSKKYGVAVFLFALFMILLTIFGENGLVKIIRLSRQLSIVKERTQGLQAQNEEIFGEINLLQNEEHYLEESVRNVLGLAKEDEIVYEFGKPSSVGSQEKPQR